MREFAWCTRVLEKSWTNKRNLEKKNASLFVSPGFLNNHVWKTRPTKVRGKENTHLFYVGDVTFCVFY